MTPRFRSCLLYTSRLSKTLNDLPEGELNSIQGALQETLTALQIELSDISGQVSSANKEDENKGKQKVTLAQIEESLELSLIHICIASRDQHDEPDHQDPLSRP